MDHNGARSSTDRIDIPVLVIGAGPAGLVTAIGLARHGVRALVVERHPSTSIFPRATGVSTRSMEIFRGWGIEDDVRRGGWRVIPRQATVRRLDDPEPREEPLGFPSEAASLAVSPTTAAVSPQDHLEPVLLAHLRELGGDVRFSTELTSFRQDGRGVDAILTDRSSGTETRVRARYLVGADGHGSTVRAGAGIAMEGPDDLGRFLSILFRADLTEVLGERRYGLYLLETPNGPPTVLVPSGADDRFVLGVPLPPSMDDAATASAFPPEHSAAMIRAAAGRPGLPVEIIATSAFAFAAQVATRMRDGRVLLVGDAAHRMTPRGGRGMNTAIADGNDLAWKLAWVLRGQASPSLLDTYEQERGPVGRRNVALSMAPGGGGTEDGLAEDLGVVVRSPLIVGGADGRLVQVHDASTPFVPDARPGARAPHAWLATATTTVSTLDLYGQDFVLVTAGDGDAWRGAARAAASRSRMAMRPVRVRPVRVGTGEPSDAATLVTDDPAFASRYGLAPGGAVLVRPDGVVAWRTPTPPADRGAALAAAVAIATGRGSAADRALLADPAGVEHDAASRAGRAA